MEKFLISRTMRDAHSTASMDYGWKRGKRRNEYIDNDGDTVKLISSCIYLRGMTDFGYYAGYRYSDAQDIEQLRMMEQQGRAKRLRA